MDNSAGEHNKWDVIVISLKPPKKIEITTKKMR